MKTALFIFFLTIFLSGCQHTPMQPEQQVVSKIEYIIKVPPSEMMILPAKPAQINVDDPNLKQSDVSHWVESRESYAQQLENKLIAIAKFFTSEQERLNDKAKKENAGK